MKTPKPKSLPATEQPEPEPDYRMTPRESDDKRGQFTTSNGWQTFKAFGICIAGYVMANVKDSDPEMLTRTLEQLGSLLGWPALPTLGIALFEWFRKDQ
jgi:hypothetical protein